MDFDRLKKRCLARLVNEEWLLGPSLPEAQPRTTRTDTGLLPDDRITYRSCSQTSNGAQGVGWCWNLVLQGNVVWSSSLLPFFASCCPGLFVAHCPGFLHTTKNAHLWGVNSSSSLKRASLHKTQMLRTVKKRLQLWVLLCKEQLKPDTARHRNRPCFFVFRQLFFKTKNAKDALSGSRRIQIILCSRHLLYIESCQMSLQNMAGHDKPFWERKKRCCNITLQTAVTNKGRWRAWTWICPMKLKLRNGWIALNVSATKAVLSAQS